MTRILFVTNPFYGHAAPCLAIANELLNRNIEVAWVTDTRFSTLANVLNSLNIPTFTHPDLQFLVTEEERHRMHNLNGQTSIVRLLSSLISIKPKIILQHRKSFFPDDQLRKRQTKALLDVIDQFKPDAIITEACVYVPDAANHAKLPWVYVAISSVALPEVNYNIPDGFMLVSRRSPLFMQRLMKWLWRKLFYDLWARGMVSPYLNILGSIPELEGTKQFNANVHYVGSLLWDRQDNIDVPKWFHSLPQDQPLIYVTVGTSVRSVEFFRLVVETFSPLNVQVIISTGMQHNLAELPSSTSNVHIVPWIPNHLILSKATLAIIHGAFSTSVGCLKAGIPAIVTGWYIDQGFYSYRFEELGVGIRLPFWKASGKRLLNAVETILTTSSYIENAKKLSLFFQNYDDAQAAADLIENMIAQS